MTKLSHIILLSALFFLGQSLHAQDNRISLQANSFSISKTDFSSNGSLRNYTTNASITQILPSLGFYHTFGSNKGMGMELGYCNFKYSQNSSYLLVSPHVQNDVFSLPHKVYYVRPEIFQTIKTNDFLLNLSLIFPVKYIPQALKKATTMVVNTETSEIVLEEHNNQLGPKIIEYGLFLGAGGFWRILKDVYVGAELAVGLGFETQFGKGWTEYIYYQEGILVKHETSIDHYKTYTSGNLDIRPAISLQYHFSK